MRTTILAALCLLLGGAGLPKLDPVKPEALTADTVEFVPARMLQWPTK